MKIINNISNNQLKKLDKFNFLCHENISCFNKCCRNINLFLYPYDVLRLKKNLKITSDKFIENHTDLVVREGNYFPDVLLRMRDNDQMTCPFLSSKGCTVYHDRPYSCRTFPVEQGTILDSNKKSTTIIKCFFKPPIFCMGKHENTKWTTNTWFKNQNAKTYIDMTIEWSKVKTLFAANSLEKKTNVNEKIKMVFMTTYNIEIFNDFVFKSSFLKRYKINNKLLKKIKTNEIELLNLGFDWIKLFGWGINSKLISKRH